MAVQISGNDITVPRDGSFTRNVTIGGTLTYEDVTNIDSVGLVTARNGIEIGTRPGVAASISVDGNMIVSGISTFGGALSGTTGTFSGAVSGTTGTFSGAVSGTTGTFSGAVSGTTGTFTGDVDIADKIIHTGDTDTAIRFPSANTVTVETSGSESTRFDSGGRLLIGTSSIVHSGTQKVQIAHTDSNAALTINRYSNNSNPPYIYLRKSRSGTIGGNTVVQDGDLLGRIYFEGNGGDGMYSAAFITSSVDGTPGSNDMPGRLGLWTSLDGTASPVERLRIDHTGRVIIGTSMSSVSSQSKLQVREDGSGANLELVRSYNSANTPARIRFANSRGTAGSPLIVADDDTIGEIRFHAYDGTDYAPIAASIFATVDGTPGSNDMPGRLEFHTTPDGNQATVERVRIDSSGRLLIGKTSTSQTYTLQVQSDSNANGIAIYGRSADDIGEIGWYENDGTTKLGELQYRQDYVAFRHRVGHIEFATTFSGDSMSERMRLFEDKLLIGMTAGSGQGASRRLQVRGTTHSNAGINVLITSNDDNPASVDIGKSRSSGNAILGNNDDVGQINFYGNDGSGSHAMARILCSCVGQDTSNDDLPSKLQFYTLPANSTSLARRLIIDNDGVSSFDSTSHVINATTTQAAGGSSHYCYRGHHSSGTISFNVWSNGNVQNTNNSYGSISDIKLKENIVDANSQWSDIKALKIRNYNFKAETKNETHTQIGVVAQELETVCPKLVTAIPDVDSEGNDLGTTTKSVNYSVLYMKAIKALQESITRIETLEAEVAALKSS